MTSAVDFDRDFGHEVAEIAGRIGVDSLHARNIGPHGVAAVALEVGEIIERCQLKFHFVVANKPDNALLQFFYAIFDPAENPAAHPTWYWMRLPRFGLVVALADVMQHAEAKMFWEAMSQPKSEINAEKARDAIDGVLGNLNRLHDPRPRELICDTLTWARNNIEQFSFWDSNENAYQRLMPNLYTLPELFGRIADDAENFGNPVEKIVHDRQLEFQSNIARWHGLFKNIVPQIELNWGDTSVKSPNISQSVFEFVDSKSSSAMQIVDVVLWVFARIQSNKNVEDPCRKLFDLVSLSGETTVISLDWIRTEFAVHSQLMLEAPQNNTALAFGGKFTERLET